MKYATSKPKPRPASAAPPEPNSKASSSSSSAADPNNTKRAGPTPAAAANPPNNANPNGAANPALLLPSPHPPRLPSPHPHLPPAAPQPLPPSRPLLTVAAVEDAMAAIPPPPQYGLENLDRRNVVLSDGTVRTYFALPVEPPLLPTRQLGPPVRIPAPERRPPMPAPAAVLPMPAPKRKWESHANGSAPGESSGRQPEEKRVVKQAKVETPEVDAKELKSSFLKMVKLINDNTEQKKNYRANGKISQLKCTVCGRDSIDLHSLLNHSYYAKSAELRADHLGLHKALCVLMGWNYSVDPVQKKAYQSLSTADAEANQGDLILWPPTVIIENTFKAKNDGQKDGMSNKEMEGKLREMGFTGVNVSPIFGKDEQRSMLVKFASSLAGLNEAEKLSRSFENQSHGRAEWYRVRNTPPGADGGSSLSLVKVDAKGERTWTLYGYLATAWDLDVLDLESKQNAVIKSRKELDLSE